MPETYLLQAWNQGTLRATRHYPVGQLDRAEEMARRLSRIEGIEVVRIFWPGQDYVEHYSRGALVTAGRFAEATLVRA